MIEPDSHIPLDQSVAIDSARTSAAPKFKVRILHVVLVILISFCAVGPPVFLRGFPTGGDFLQHLRFAISYSESLDAGKLQPDWTNDNFGFGSVGVRVYP